MKDGQLAQNIRILIWTKENSKSSVEPKLKSLDTARDNKVVSNNVVINGEPKNRAYNRHVQYKNKTF